MTKPLYILNGPNLNLLGTREPEVYGAQTLGDIEALCAKRAKSLKLEIRFLQSNTEGELVDWVHEAGAKGAGLIINAGAYTHTSIALLDAVKAVTVPTIEVHLSNIFAREDFRHQSYISRGALGIICGLGDHGYELAIDALARAIAD